MSIKMIAAIGKDNSLGRNNQLIWHFNKDLNFFRDKTLGHHILMGRKTFESLPKKLDGRVNIVLSKKNLEDCCDIICYHNIKDVLSNYFYNENNSEDLYIIGGAEIYRQFLPYADTMYLTEIQAVCNDADTFFPYYDSYDWKRILIDEEKEEGIKYNHVKYLRKGRVYYGKR